MSAVREMLLGLLWLGAVVLTFTFFALLFVFLWSHLMPLVMAEP